MSAIDPTKLDTCGCCEGETEKEPRFNPPGQAALNYRVGTHPTFLKQMLERIHRWQVPSGDTEGKRPFFEVLTTRATDDPAIALMDAWAVAADVLTFYQERIANEGFLRTATERRSILELARAIGYELDPGVAAEAWLAFTVDDAEGAPTESVVAAGTQVQSIPAGAGELPQTFETGETFTAYRRWNAMRLRLAHPQTLTEHMTHAYLSGTGLGLQRGDLVLLVATGRYPKKIRKVTEDGKAQRTRIEFDAALSEPSTAVIPGLPAELDPEQEALELTAENVREQIYEKTWQEPDLQALLTHHGWEPDDVLVYVDELRAEQLRGAGALHALRETVSFFGHNAPYYGSLPTVPEEGKPTPLWPHDWDDEEFSIWHDSIENDYYDPPFDVYLNRPVADLAEGSWVVFQRPAAEGETLGIKYETFSIKTAAEASLTGYGMSAKAMGLKLLDASGNELDDAYKERSSAFQFRRSVAHVKSEELILGPIPLDADVPKGTTELWLGAMVLGLREGQRVALRGEDVATKDTLRREILTIAAVTHGAGLTKLKFDEPGLAYNYRRDTISINANIALASHGETVSDEVLGSGDGSAPHQAFELKKPPLTYVAVGTASGSESTLTVRVDGVEWDEAPSLYFLGPDSKSFIVRIEGDANTKVIFGDGKKGARLPTGEENVVAEYRSGIGLRGKVAAGALTLLKKRPFGIREVTNPFAAGGGDDPEILEDARVNAPLTVLTLDRIVSLQDYEDFARAYPGIGKAQAVTVWDGEREVVHVTVADASGDEVVAPLDENLRNAIHDARDPLRDVVLASFQPLSFFVSARMLIDEAYLWADVKAAVEAALLKAFSFKERGFGQPVAAAEVMQEMHDVDGVVAVDLDWLDKTAPPDGPPGTSFNAVLDCQVARFDKNHVSGPKILPAQLLLIHPLGIRLTEMTT